MGPGFLRVGEGGGIAGNVYINGNVGIGTATPTVRLDVAGIIKTTDATANNASDTTTGALLVTGGASFGSGITTGGATYLGLTTAGGGGRRYVEIGTDAANQSYIDFHSQDSRTIDYDARIISTGGSATTGTATINFAASQVETGGIIKTTNTTASTDTLTGALQVAGGVGVVGRIYAGGVITTTTALASTDTTTGALVVAGGAGIGGRINAGGIIKTTTVTASTDTTTGALVVGGGAGIAGAVNVGGIIKTTNATANSANNTTTGALVVTGGGAFGSGITTGGETYLSGSTYRTPYIYATGSHVFTPTTTSGTREILTNIVVPTGYSSSQPIMYVSNGDFTASSSVIVCGYYTSQVTPKAAGFTFINAVANAAVRLNYILVFP
jgi:hypothetical protein